MKVNSVGSTNFKANPSNIVRTCIAKAMTEGQDVNKLVQLMLEVYPKKYVTMLQREQKVYSVGLTDVFDATAALSEKSLPEGDKKWEQLNREFNKKKNPTREDMQKFADDAQKLREKYIVPVIEEPNGYISLFKDVAGKKFNEIIEPITTALEKIQQGQSPLQRAKDKLDSIFPQYSDMEKFRRMEKEYDWNQPMTI